MGSALERLAALAQGLKVRTARREQTAVVISVLLGVLLWQTKWPSLRPGLTILLLAYVGSALVLLYRTKRLAQDIEQVNEGLFKPDRALHWFDREQAWTRGLMLFETLSRTLGFLVLGYGFYAATGSVTVAIALGVVYPALSFLGLEWRSYERQMRSLGTERENLDAPRFRTP